MGAFRQRRIPGLVRFAAGEFLGTYGTTQAQSLRPQFHVHAVRRYPGFQRR